MLSCVPHRHSACPCTMVACSWPWMCVLWTFCTKMSSFIYLSVERDLKIIYGRMPSVQQLLHISFSVGEEVYVCTKISSRSKMNDLSGTHNLPIAMAASGWRRSGMHRIMRMGDKNTQNKYSRKMYERIFSLPSFVHIDDHWVVVSL